MEGRISQEEPLTATNFSRVYPTAAVGDGREGSWTSKYSMQQERISEWRAVGWQLVIEFKKWH